MRYVSHKLSETIILSSLDGARCQLMKLSGASKAHPALFAFSNPGSLCHWTSAFTQILTCTGHLHCWDGRALSTSLAILHQLPGSAVLKPWSAFWTPAVKAFSTVISENQIHSQVSGHQPHWLKHIQPYLFFTAIYRFLNSLPYVLKNINIGSFYIWNLSIKKDWKPVSKDFPLLSTFNFHVSD